MITRLYQHKAAWWSEKWNAQPFKFIHEQECVQSSDFLRSPQKCAQSSSCFGHLLSNRQILCVSQKVRTLCIFNAKKKRKYLLLFSYFMCGSCHFDRESNYGFSVEFWMFVWVISSIQKKGYCISVMDFLYFNSKVCQ